MRRALLLALLFIGADVLAQSPSPPVVSGRVLAAGTDVPLRRARVELAGRLGSPSDPVLTDDVGRFSINGIDIVDTGYDFGSQPDTVTGSVLVLSRHGASVSGRLRTSHTGSYFVVVFPTARDTRFGMSRRVKFARAATDGSFQVRGLPPGEYFVAAVDRMDGTADGGEWQNPELLLRLESGAERVSLVEGQAWTVSLGLAQR